MARKPAFTFVNHLSIFLVTPNTRTAAAWAREHIDADALGFGKAIVVEPRYVLDLLHGVQDAGFNVELR